MTNFVLSNPEGFPFADTFDADATTLAANYGGKLPLGAVLNYENSRVNYVVTKVSSAVAGVRTVTIARMPRFPRINVYAAYGGALVPLNLLSIPRVGEYVRYNQYHCEVSKVEYLPNGVVLVQGTFTQALW